MAHNDMMVSNQRLRVHALTTCGLLLVGALWCFAWWFGRSDDQQMLPQSGAVVEEAGPSSQATMDRSRDLLPAVTVVRSLALTGATVHVTHRGEPVEGCGLFDRERPRRYTLSGDELAMTGASGDMQVGADVLARGTGHYYLSHREFEPFDLGQVRPGEHRDVELRQGNRIRAVVVDAMSGRPIRGAEVCVAQHMVSRVPRLSVSRPGPDPFFAIHCATTDDEGRAEVRGLADADYNIRCFHSTSIACSGVPRVRLPTDELIEIRMKVPVVLGLHFVGGKILTNDMNVVGCDLTESVAGSVGILRDLRNEFGGSRQSLFFCGMPSSNASALARITLWTDDGRKIDLERHLLPWTGRVVPETVDVAGMGRQLPTGSVELSCIDSKDRSFNLRDVFIRPSMAYSPAIFVSMDARPLLLRLPADEYVVASSHKGLTRCFQRRRPVITVEPGVAKKVAVRLHTRPTRLEWAVRAQDGLPVPEGHIIIADAEGRTIHEALTGPSGYTWVPSGAVYSYKAEAPGCAVSGECAVPEDAVTAKLVIELLRIE